jgi:hypothetical protein
VEKQHGMGRLAASIKIRGGLSHIFIVKQKIKGGCNPPFFISLKIIS